MLVRESRVFPPALDNYSDLPLFNTKAVVHQTGVPAPTLRAWERRYGILSPRRGENDYRLYSERDIATVTWLRERVETGMTISQAIALLRSLEPQRKRTRRGRGVAVASEPSEPFAHAGNSAPPSRFAPQEMSQVLLGHFVRLDEAAATRVIAQALAVYTVEDVCLSLLTPVLFEIGKLWAQGQISVTVEHFASAIVRAQLDGLYRSAGAFEGGPHILVGCAPSELHELGPLMLALFLRRAGLRVLYLGQNLEPASLVATVQMAKPAAVLLSATLPSGVEALVEVGERVRAVAGQRTLLFLGGQAFRGYASSAPRLPGELLALNGDEATQEIRRRLTA